ncbi:MAG: sulfotransferase [Alphaproteobacteria bacterium]|nr:sulfotransferase [Alphaproteobacteria bacterium]
MPLSPNDCDFTPLFVGGPPRTGTTLVHALVCTAEETNGFISECSYFTRLVSALASGLDLFEVHTRYYFDSREELTFRLSNIIIDELTYIHRKLDRPRILILKDPFLTLYFPLLAKVLPNAAFIVCVRDPRDTIASRIEVTRRDKPGSRITSAKLTELCCEYVNIYQQILRNLDLFRGRLQFVGYEELLNPKTLLALQKLGLSKINPDNLWNDGITNINESPHIDNPWSTPLYGKQISSSSIGRYRSVLSRHQQQVVWERCREIAVALGIIK